MRKLFQTYAAPSKKWARILGDSLLASSAILAGATFANPAWEQKRIAIYVIVGIIGKFLTNFTVETPKTITNE